MNEALVLLNLSSVDKYFVGYLNAQGDWISKGYLIVNIRKDLEDRPVGMIEDIWTHEDYRGRGLARKVIEALIEKAKELGCYKIVLSCADHNVGLYEKFGFTKHQNAMRLSLK